jgi:hypothetical protein
MEEDFDLHYNVADPDYIDPTHSDKNQHNLSSSSNSDTDTESVPSTPEPSQFRFSKTARNPNQFCNSTYSQPFGPRVPVILLSHLEIL